MTLQLFALVAGTLLFLRERRLYLENKDRRP